MREGGKSVEVRDEEEEEGRERGTTTTPHPHTWRDTQARQEREKRVANQSVFGGVGVLRESI